MQGAGCGVRDAGCGVRGAEWGAFTQRVEARHSPIIYLFPYSQNNNQYPKVNGIRSFSLNLISPTIAQQPRVLRSIAYRSPISPTDL